MEQKKIFWIVIAVSVFLLVIFGTAIVLYWPSRSTGTSLQQAAVLTPANGTNGSGGTSPNQIDPDAWVREPGTTPGLDANATPPGNINLTIVNGDNAGANYGIVDVNGLTKAPAPVETSDAVKTAVDPSGQSGQTTVTSKAGTTDSGAILSKTTTVKTEMTVQTAAKPAAVKASPAVKPAAQKTVLVTEYWIQTGSFSNKINAEKARDTLTGRYLKAEIFTKEVSGKTSYRVRVGPYKSKTESDYWLGTVKEIPEFSGSYVSEVKTKK